MMEDVHNLAQTIQGMAQRASEDNNPGPGDVGATTQTKNNNPLVTLPMTPEEIKEWWVRIEEADQRRKNREGGWDILLKSYLPSEIKDGPQDLKVSRHFRDVHTKIGNLFYRSPELILLPKDPGPANNQIPNPQPQMPGMPPPPPLTMQDVISVKQAVLDQKLGADEIDALSLIDEMLFDCLGWSGIACSKLGYRCAMKPIQQPKMVPAQQSPLAPGTLGIAGAQSAPPPMVPQLDATGQPVMETVEVPVFEEWYWRRFSPKKLLFNGDLRSTRYDQDATWVGMWVFMSPKKAMQDVKLGGLGLTEGEATKIATDDRVHEYPEDKQGSKSNTGLVACVELTCKLNYFTDEIHPQAMGQLVLVKGLDDRPIVWRPSPDQEFDERGQLTKDSLIGFPIRILALRDLADSPFPPSDSAFTDGEVKELTTWRRQSIQLRDRAIGKYLYDKGAFEEGEIDKLKDGSIGDYVGVSDGRLKEGPDKILTIAAQIHQTADDVRNQELLRRDLDEALGIGSNQSGASEQTVRSATETATVQAAVNARNDKELSRVVKFYLQGVRMIDQLLMRYADSTQYVHITGDMGARKMQVWNNELISGKFLYDISPDSQLRPDNARDWQELLNFYNIAAPDPLCNRPYLLRRLARMKGLDPDKVVVPPTMMPGQPGQLPPHGGTATASQPVNKHQASNSGARPNEPQAPNHRENQSV